jgi:hypothetical protein
MKHHILPRAAVFVALFQSLHCAAITCEELRPQVEAKIRARGVTQFSIAVVDAAAPSVGQVVGSCDRGAKKLLYTSVGPKASAPTAAAKADKKPAPVITECKDGSVAHAGGCKQ